MKSAPGQEKWYTLVCINPYDGFYIDLIIA
jgi:hypothetical protein